MTVGINSVAIEQAAECSMARRVEASWHTCELFPSFKIMIFLNKVYNNSTEVWMPRSLLRLSRVDTGAQQFPSAKESAICNSGREDEITRYTFPALTELRYPHNEYSHRCDYCSRALPIPPNPPPKTISIQI